MPDKLTDEVKNKLIDAIRAGNYVTVAARYAGISPSTFWRWMRMGRKAKKGQYHDFHEEIRTAETFAEVIAVSVIRKRLKDDWRAAVSYLERKFPSRWSNRKDRSMPNKSSRRAVPAVLRLSHEAEFLGEVARILDESGAIGPVAGVRADAKVDQRDSASADSQAGRVSAA